MHKRTLLAAAAAVAAYAGASHWLMLHAAAKPWALFVVMGPLVLGGLAAAWQRRHVCALVLCAAALPALAMFSAWGGVDDAQRLYVLQYLGINLALGGMFAATLRRGSTPLITQLASRLHPHFPPPMRAYTTRLTQWWAGYFALMSLLCIALYAWAPWSWWSLFANLLTPLAVLAFLVGEHQVRYRLHPDFERVSITGALQAWRQLDRHEAGR